MLSRRLFLKYFSVGAIPLRRGSDIITLFDPFDPLSPATGFNFEFNRCNDLLRLHFYFINAERKGSHHLGPIRSNQTSYMLIRLPQMHISEQTLTDCQFWKIADFDEVNTAFGPTYYDHGETVHSYLSSFSFLVFRMDFQGQTRILLTEDFLMDWDKHTLLRTEDVGNQAGLPFLIEEKAVASPYPIIKPDGIGQFVTSDGIPVSFFEMPYKMFLSPTLPDSFDPAKAAKTTGFKFPSNSQVPWEQVYKIHPAPHREVTVRITELYSSEMFFFDPTNAESPYSAPYMRIIGYANELKSESNAQIDNTTVYHCTGAASLPANVSTYGLLPYGSDKSDPLPGHDFNHRLNLAKLSNLSDAGGAHFPDRNLNTTKFLLTSWGGYTTLCYYNLEDHKYRIVSFKDKIVLGRDERVEVVTMGKDHFGIKCFYIRISQATLVNGKHFMNYYVIIKYPKDAKVEYDFNYSRKSLLNDDAENKCRYIPFKSIRPKTFSTPKLDPLRHIIPITNGSFTRWGVPPGFYPGLAIRYNNRPLDLEYEGVDHNGTPVARITKPLIFIDDAAWGYPDALREVNTLIRDGADLPLKDGNFAHLVDYRIAKVYRIKLAYAPLPAPPAAAAFDAKKTGHLAERAYDQEGSTAAQRKENELETEKLDFNIDISLTNLPKDTFPILPALREASVYLPQVAGLLHEDVQVGVSFTKSYIDHAFDFAGNKAKVYANLTEQGMQTIATKLRDVQNMKMLGGFVTPDIPIAAISILNQSVTLYEHVNKVVDDGTKILQISPSEILRGKFPEVFKGIDLLRILNDYLPLENTPVFQVVQKFDEAVAAGDQFFATIAADVKAEKDRIQGDIANFQQQLAGYQAKYDAISRDVKSKLAERFQVVNNDIEFASRVVRSLNATAVNVLKDEKDFVDKQLLSFAKDITDRLDTIPAALMKLYVAAAETVDQARIRLKAQFDKFSTDCEKQLDSLFNDFFTAITDATKWPSAVEAVDTQLQACKKVLAKLVAAYTQFTGVDFPGSVSADPKLTAAVTPNFASAFAANCLDTVTRKHTVRVMGYIKVSAGLNDAQAKNVYSVLAYLLLRLEKEYNNVKTVPNILLVEGERALFSDAILYLKDKVKLFTGYYDDRIQFLQLEAKNAAAEFAKAGVPKADFDTIAANARTIAGSLQQFSFPVSAQVDTTTGEFKKLYASLVKAAQDGVAAQKAAINNIIDRAIQSVLDNIKTYTDSLAQSQWELKNYLTTFVDNEVKSLQNLQNQLTQAVAAQRQAILDQISQVQRVIDFLRNGNTIHRQYAWDTTHFQDVDLGGIIQFKRHDYPATSLNILATGDIVLDYLHSPPSVKDFRFSAHTAFKDFSLVFLGVLDISFKEVTYDFGSQQSGKFNVMIDDVSFGGSLSFLSLLQDLLKTVDDGLDLKITPQYVELTYSIAIPDIPPDPPPGAFSLCNLSLGFGLRLPFDGNPIYFEFLVSKPNDKFRITAGIYAGWGFFGIGVEPKTGVRMMEIGLEFGCYGGIHLGPLEGHIQIAAGLYYKRDGSVVILSAYVACEGMAQLWFVSIYVYIYLGIESRNNVVRGVCIVEYSIKIGFLKKGFSRQFEKQINGSGAGPNNDDGGQARLSAVADGRALDTGCSKNNVDKGPGLRMSDEEFEEYWNSFF